MSAWFIRSATMETGPIAVCLRFRPIETPGEVILLVDREGDGYTGYSLGARVGGFFNEWIGAMHILITGAAGMSGRN